jgi:fatty-acyl-CoA synthase
MFRERHAFFDVMHTDKILTEAAWLTDSAPRRTIDTVHGALCAAAAAWPDRTALVDGDDLDRRWTFSDLLLDAEQVAATLQQRFAPGEHLAVWAPSSAEWVLLEFGAALAGIVLVTVNPALTSREAAYVLARSEAVGVVASREYRGNDLLAASESLREDLPLLRDVIAIGDTDTAASFAPVAIDGSAPAQVQFTSGTTGQPKGVLLSHRGLVDNAAYYAERIAVGESDVWINPMPLFHTAGCGLATLGALQSGGCQVLLSAFDPHRLLHLIEEEHATTVLGVPTMLVRVLEAQRARPRNVSSLRLWTLGGAPVSPELVRRARRNLDISVSVGFGQTEASPYITHTDPRDPTEADDTVGRPLPYTSVRITDPGTGHIVGLGVVGELETRSHCVMLGYYGDHEATAASIDGEGWLRTGDLASMDERGFVRIVGRARDMIIRGGENIYPREIEDLLTEHPAVIQAAVVGVPDPDWGETVAAFIQIRGVIDAAALDSYCRAYLAAFKCPRIWRFVGAFPQTASGKIRKGELREGLIAEVLAAEDVTSHG